MNKEPVKNFCSEKDPECHICKAKITDTPYRFLVVKDKVFQKHKMFSYHYFYPCWDIGYVCKNLGNDEIIKAGFCCDNSILKNPQAVKNMKKNGELWDIEVVT